MEFKKKIIDGIEYNLLTDEDLEDLKVLYRNEDIIKKMDEGNVEGVQAKTFLKELKLKYGL